jgi:hypothetical protein
MFTVKKNKNCHFLASQFGFQCQLSHFGSQSQSIVTFWLTVTVNCHILVNCHTFWLTINCHIVCQLSHFGTPSIVTFCHIVCQLSHFGSPSIVTEGVRQLSHFGAIVTFWRSQYNEFFLLQAFSPVRRQPSC